MFMSVTILALVTKVKAAEFDADLIGLPAGEDQKTVIAQIARAVFGNSRRCSSTSRRSPP